MRSITKSLLATQLLAAALLAASAPAQGHDHPVAAATPSGDTERAFALIKSLSGNWRGPVVSPMATKQEQVDVSMRVTSRGNSVVHEMKGTGLVDDPTKNDHPVTMFYVEGANLLLTHFCDAGNRPRMTARVSPDGKKVDFDFLDVTGPVTYGHMQHAAFTVVDATHHIEEWTYLKPDGKPVTGHLELQRVTDVATRTAP